MTWNDVTYKQFTELQKIFELDDDTERVINTCVLFFGEEVLDEPLPKLKDRIAELGFLQDTLPEVELLKKVKVKNREYEVNAVIGELTTAQYVDYINHIKNNDIVKALSVFYIPKGHKYNDGYDMELVFQDIENLPIPVVNGTAFFLRTQLNKFIEIFLSSSIKKIKNLKTRESLKKKIIEALENTANLESSLLFSDSANPLITPSKKLSKQK